MRIVNREEFFKLKPPFMFIKVDEHGNTQEELMMCIGLMPYSGPYDIEPWKGDFVVNPLVLDPDTDSSEAYHDLMFRMFEDSDLDAPAIDMNTSRDGCFDHDQMFRVYSKEDFKLFASLINAYNEVYGEEKDIKYMNY